MNDFWREGIEERFCSCILAKSNLSRSFFDDLRIYIICISNSFKCISIYLLIDQFIISLIFHFGAYHIDSVIFRCKIFQIKSTRVHCCCDCCMCNKMTSFIYIHTRIIFTYNM